MNRPSRFNGLWLIWLPVSVLILAFILDRYIPRQQPPSEAHFWAQAGLQAFNSGDNQQAIQYLNMAAQEHDLSASGWIVLGDANLAAGDPAAALDAWQNLPVTTELLERRLQAHRMLSDYPAAIADLRALLQLQPLDANHSYQLGLYLATTQPEQAVRYLNQAEDLSSNYSNAARLLTHRIQAAQATSQPAYILLEAGRGLADLQEWELAAQAFHNATLLRPDYSEAWAFLGEALQHVHIPPGQAFSTDGLTELKLALQLDPESLSANLFLALYWRRQKQWAAALEPLQKLARQDPANPLIQVELGNTLAEKGDPRAALPYYTQAVKLDPPNPEYWLAMANFSINYQFQVRQVALPAARQLLLLTPTDPEALDVMGQALFLLEDPLNAERYFRRAVQLDDGYAPAHLHLAQIYQQRGAILAARQELEQTVALAPGSGEAEIAIRLLQSNSP